MEKEEKRAESGEMNTGRNKVTEAKSLLKKKASNIIVVRFSVMWEIL